MKNVRRERVLSETGEIVLQLMGFDPSMPTRKTGKTPKIGAAEGKKKRRKIAKESRRRNRV